MSWIIILESSRPNSRDIIVFIIHKLFIKSANTTTNNDATKFADEILIFILSNVFKDGMIHIKYDLDSIFKNLCHYKLKSNVNKTLVIAVTINLIDRTKLNSFILMEQRLPLNVVLIIRES